MYQKYMGDGDVPIPGWVSSFVKGIIDTYPLVLKIVCEQSYLPSF